MEDNKPYHSPLQTILPDKFRKAEEKLRHAEIPVTRLVRTSGEKKTYKAECFGLSVFGSDYHDVFKIQSILGDDFKLIPNFNSDQIIIK